eukprot:m.141021 g.141021  ORF g.141021 m.141021 type:complete len:104 (+) comp13191_c0_seq1:763-1074(+)
MRRQRSHAKFRRSAIHSSSYTHICTHALIWYLLLSSSKKGLGAPAREPLYDEETQKKMMAYAYKKQEEWKKLSENEDDYMNSAWADGRALKKQMHGTNNIKFK